MTNNLRKFVQNEQIVMALLSVVMGIIVGAMVVAFREGIQFFQGQFFGASDENLSVFVASLPWQQVVLVPTIGGLFVGVIIRFFMDEGRPRGVADVIEASVLKNGQMSLMTGVRGAFVNMISIGVGASVGREGPAVHLGASLAVGLAKPLHLSPVMMRILLGCGVGAAVAASFNAPIAGALFAGEVVIGHYALKTFAPVVISSVTGTAVFRAYFGDLPTFSLPHHEMVSYFEFPAFLVLGVFCGLIAVMLMRGIFKAQDIADVLPIPSWAHPAVGGLIVGLIALELPQVLGVGYGATDQALMGNMALVLLVSVLVGKLVATMISIGFGFGGGIFSPSLMIGALTGGAFGIVITYFFPLLETEASGYTLVGMGAMAAATLGAPISTTLIIFELTGDYQLTLGVMLAVVTSTAVTRHMIGCNFFTLQLKRRGLDLLGGFENQVLRDLNMMDVLEHTTETVMPNAALADVRQRLLLSKAGKLYVVDKAGILVGTIRLAELGEAAFEVSNDHGRTAQDVMRKDFLVLYQDDHLQSALQVLTEAEENQLGVVENSDTLKFVGTVEQMHVLAAYNRALLARRHEEHDQ